MVATLVRLRLRLIANGLRRDVWRLLLFILGSIWALSLVPIAFGGALWLRTQGLDVIHDVLIILGVLLMIGWVLVPILIFGSDETLDPARFALYAIPSSRLAPGLLISGFLSIPAAFTLLISALAAIAWSALGPLASVTAVVVAPMTMALCVAVSRVFTTAISRALSSRRGREISGIAFVLLLASVGPLFLAADGERLERALEYVPRIAEIAAWTPFGLTWALPSDIAGGHYLRGSARLILALAVFVALMFIWGKLLDRIRTSPPVSGSRIHRNRLTRLVSRPWMPKDGATATVAARSWRFWFSDPRYVTSFTSFVLVSGVMVALIGSVWETSIPVLVFAAPIFAAMVGWSMHNDLIYDGSAMWIHLATGLPGHADRRGRTWAIAMWALPGALVIAVSTTYATGRLGLLPSIVGISMALMLSGWGVSAITSVVLPYPVPKAGDSPFATQSGAAMITMLAQFVSSVGTVIVCFPVLVLAYVAIFRDIHWAGWLALVLGIVGGGLLTRLGHQLGGAIFERRAVMILQQTRVWDL